MENFNKLRQEMKSTDYSGQYKIYDCLFADAVKNYYDDDFLIAKSKAVADVFRNHKKVVYKNDLILGSYSGCFEKDIPELQREYSRNIRDSYVIIDMLINVGHGAPYYEFVLENGIQGVFDKINGSKQKYKDDNEKLVFLNCAEISLSGLVDMIKGYGAEAERIGKLTEAEICRKIATEPPETFREALQLMWLVHLSFTYNGSGAMAFGRADQFLYPFYKKDIERGLLTFESATELIACTIFKLYELQQLSKTGNPTITTNGDVVNICIGGVDKEGNDAVNELSYAFLNAVEECAIPGPNLSARISGKTSDEFLDACLKVIGTGIGYPALMNDEVNIKALLKNGYKIEDCRNYCMVGCIENLIPGKQPPWSDGHGFNQAKCLEFVLNNGRCMQTGALLGVETGNAEEIDSMEKFLNAYRKQIEFKTREEVALYNQKSTRYDKEKTLQPYLSCFTTTCIDRGLDLRYGGSEYPRVHGFGTRGVSTIVDSLAAIEKVVFEEKAITLAKLRDVLLVDFEGYDDIRIKLLKAPKYGNNNEFADKYARMLFEIQYNELMKYRTPDGGKFCMLAASNIFNVMDGAAVAATPDGRKNKAALSDASSPMRGQDKNGLTQAILSVSKPDYTCCAGGTVYNIKLTEDMFSDENKRKMLLSMIRVYMQRGGQEMQFNCVSKEILKDAMENPDDYSNLVVRVSGFSAFYTGLKKSVQQDVLERTEHSNV